MKVVCFDLDDTLYKEIDFLKSAFREITEYALSISANLNMSADDLYEGMLDAYFSKKDAFDYLVASVGIDLGKQTLLNLYRNHVPQIALSEGAFKLLTVLKNRGYEVGVITDGRSVQQRNKIKALGLDKIVSEKNLVISEEFGSEKPSLLNYEYFVERYPLADEFIYIGDNLRKDFIAPNKLGWKTICLLDDGQNIHKQDFSMPAEYLAQIVVNSLIDVAVVLHDVPDGATVVGCLGKKSSK